VQTLAERLAGGDDAAFAELYDDCAERLFAFVAMRLGSRELAADVVQATFLRVVKSRRQFRRVENPIAYVFQIARNESKRVLGKRYLQNEAAIDVRELADIRAGLGADDIEAAKAALARLDVVERELVELKVYGGLTFQEIVVATGMPLGTVTTKYRRALESLRGWLSRQYR
jgi:RNA polymerase sigma-70 factor (ECF subfamily)